MKFLAWWFGLMVHLAVLFGVAGVPASLKVLAGASLFVWCSGGVLCAVVPLARRMGRGTGLSPLRRTIPTSQDEGVAK